jgi:Zn-dependent peptidase ImmA (M78 family)
VSGTVTGARAAVLQRRYQTKFGGESLPVPERIAEELLGLAVENTKIGVSGRLLAAQREILLNTDEPEARRRFTLAHEVGHWVCQCLEGTAAPVYCCPKDLSARADRVLERKVDVFAAELLMPEAEVQATWDGDADACAARFGVSGEAMRWRLYSFELDARPNWGNDG